MKKYNVWYCKERIGLFDLLIDAQKCINDHPNYKKSWFTKKGRASANNPNQKESYSIYDTDGYGWHIRS